MKFTVNRSAFCEALKTVTAAAKSGSVTGVSGISLRRRFKENIGAYRYRRYNLGCKAHTKRRYKSRRRDHTAAHSA